MPRISDKSLITSWSGFFRKEEKLILFSKTLKDSSFKDCALLKDKPEDLSVSIGKSFICSGVSALTVEHKFKYIVFAADVESCCETMALTSD